MRIARILTRLNLGGPARQSLGADPILVERGHVVRILAGEPEPGEGDLFEAFRERGLDVVRIKGLRRGVSPARDLFALRRIRKELADFAPDLLHTHASKAGTLGRQASFQSHADSALTRVHTFHGHVLEGYFPPIVSRRLIAHERRLAERTDRIIAVSHQTADDLIRLEVTEEKKLVVVPPGLDLAPFLELPLVHGEMRTAGALRHRLGLEDGDQLVGIVGRLAEVKQPERAIVVFELLRRRFQRLHLVFIGDGSERRALENRILELDEDGQARVHLLGAVYEMAPILRELDCLLSTSRAEGMPVAMIEAAAAGLPVIATPVGGVEELVVHERTGMIGTSDEELAFGLAQLLENSSERLACGQRARMRVERKHSAPALADRLEAVYRAATRTEKDVS